jgi:hypothetical protein
VIGHAAMMTMGDMIDVPDLPGYLHAYPGDGEHAPSLLALGLSAHSPTGSARCWCRRSRGPVATHPRPRAFCASAEMPSDTSSRSIIPTGENHSGVPRPPDDSR